MLNKKFRIASFWIVFVVILLLPTLLGVMYISQLKKQSTFHFNREQNSILARVADKNMNQLTQLKSMLSGTFSRSAINTIDLINVHQRSFKNIIGYIMTRSGRRISSHFFKKYSPASKRLRAILNYFRNSKSGLYLYDQKGDAYICIYLSTQNKRLLLLLNHAKLFTPVFSKKLLHLAVVSVKGVVLFNSYSDGLNGKRYNSFEIVNGLKISNKIKQLKSGNIKVRFKVPGLNRFTTGMITWKRIYFSNSSAHLVMYAPFFGSSVISSADIREIVFVVLVLLIVTGFLGTIYYKSMRSATLAIKKARMIPGMEQNIAVLGEAKKRYSTLFNSIMDGIILTDMDGRIIECNQAFADMISFAADELSGSDIKNLTPPKYWQKEERYFKEQLLRWGFAKDYEKEFVRKDGSLVPVMANCRLIQHENTEQDNILFTVKDISAQKRADREIEKLHRLLEDIIESSPSSFITLNERLEVTSFNSSAEKFFGIRRDKILHKFLPTVIPLFQRYKKCFDKAINWKMTSMLNAEEFSMNSKDIKITNITFYPLYSEQRPGIVVHMEDITEQTLLERQLIQSQKMEALGTLASGFAHDFNNLLSGIFSYSSILKMRVKEDEQLKYVNTIADIAQRASTLVQHILTFSRSSKIKAHLVSMQSIVEEVLLIISRSISKKIVIEKNIPNNECFVMGDAAQISQVLMNLCINASDAMPNGGKLSIDLKEETINETHISHFRMLKPGNVAKITIRDTGVGIPADIRDKIFDPFFTTKVKGKGTGLGLSIVYGIVRNHKGDIIVHSESGSGTAIEVFLPLAKEKKKVVKREEIIEPEQLHGQGNILIIDDEEVICLALEDGLSRLGYTVFIASNGDEGIEKCRKEKIDLVVLDMIMQGLSGEETFDLIKEEFPEMKVIIHTGFTQPEIQKRMESKGVLTVVHKPYDIMKMALLISKFMSDTSQNSSPPAE